MTGRTHIAAHCYLTAGGTHLATMLKLRRNMILGIDLPLSEEESKQANECKLRTLKILHDALKKKGALLVDNPAKFSNQEEFRYIPLISTDLVKDLISKLQKVTFKRNKDPGKEKGTLAYVHPTSETETIYLCQGFWKLPEFLEINSRPETLIHEVAHLLGYGHTILKNKENVKMSQQHKLCPVSVHCIETAFSVFMNHRETYSNGSYSCCGETSQDTLCEKSDMTQELRDQSGMDDPRRLRFLRSRLLHENKRLFSMMEDLMTKINIIPTQLQEDTVPGSSWITLPAKIGRIELKPIFKAEFQATQKVPGISDSLLPPISACHILAQSGMAVYVVIM